MTPGSPTRWPFMTNLVDNHGCCVKIVQSSIAKDYTAHRQRGGNPRLHFGEEGLHFTGS